jgi:uncharacterized protein YjbI with pentapeptide repeats
VANSKQVGILNQGSRAWNQWRRKNPRVEPDLSKADLGPVDLSRANLGQTDLSGAGLGQANLRRAYFIQANLRDANLHSADLRQAHLSYADLSASNLNQADLSGADLTRANLSGADLSMARLDDADLRGANLSNTSLSDTDLSGANLSRAELDLSEEEMEIAAGLESEDFSWQFSRPVNLSNADLTRANLTRANLSEANLSRATLVGTKLEGTNLSGCTIYGISVWDVKLEGAIQSNLVITPPDESSIQVDNLEIAQFIYLLLNNDKIRDVIDTIGKRAVLILGRFTKQRKAVLDAIREKLRKQGYLPILFDFEKPASRDITETVRTLAHLARFVVADITDAKSIPQELMAIVPNLPSVPVQPLLLGSQHEYGMFEHFRRFPWVLKPFLYKNRRELLAELVRKVIAPAEAKAKEQTGR